MRMSHIGLLRPTYSFLTCRRSAFSFQSFVFSIQLTNMCSTPVLGLNASLPVSTSPPKKPGGCYIRVPFLGFPFPPIAHASLFFGTTCILRGTPEFASRILAGAPFFFHLWGAGSPCGGCFFLPAFLLVVCRGGMLFSSSGGDSLNRTAPIGRTPSPQTHTPSPTTMEEWSFFFL